MQRLKLDINPKGEIPVLYASQYDKGRLFEVELVDGEQSYNVPSGYSVQLNVRKTDSKLVTATPTSVADNILTFATTEQMTACAGENIGSVTLKDVDDYVITTLYFLISVQRDVLAGGLNSASEIHNLEEQIAAIVPEVISDDYYNKTETDALLANKANVSDLATLASKAELEYAIAEEDAAVKDWVSSHFATPGYVADRYYNKTQVDELIDNIFPTLSASGAIASFKTALNKHLVSVTHEAVATTITRCGKNFCNITDKTISSAGYVIGAAPQFINGEHFYLPSGKYTFSFDITNATYPNACQIIVYGHGIEVTRETKSGISQSGKITITFTANAEINQILLYCNSSTGGSFSNFQMEVGSTATAFETFNSQTVPVVDATTLTTLSGVNNVFADNGDVTVQYKYMSI